MNRCDKCLGVVNKHDEPAAKVKSEKSDGNSNLRWLCFSGLCGNKTVEAPTGEIATYDDVLPSGVYNRRKTIQFDLDSDGSDAKNKTNFASILKPSRGPHEAKFGQIVPPHKHHLKLLNVFPSIDQAGETFTKAAEKLGFEVTNCQTDTAALEEYQSKFHDLVVVDTRFVKGLDYDTLCRSIRNSKGSQHTVIVAMVKKCIFEKDDIMILSLLDAGFNRCLIETTNVITCVNELLLLKHSDIRPMAHHATCQALYTALDKCRDVVVVTDDNYKLQYINRACEKQLGLRQEECLGKTLQEQLINDTIQINTMGSSLLRTREWNGAMTLKRKSQENLVTTCKAVPFTCSGKRPSHFILIFDATPMDVSILAQSRGSVHSIRRGSTDVRSVGSDYLRRTSLAKLNALPLEAPITKIISLIDQAREGANNNSQVVQLLDKVEDILRCSELYSPHVKEDTRMRADEPVVSDLITALLSCLIETTNVITCVNELLLLKHSDIRPMAHHATCQALYTALDKCRDVVVVTDDNYKLQYINRACEKQLGLRQEECLGKTLQEQLINDTIQINTMGSSLLRTREWNGAMTLKRKSQENLVTTCKAMPFTCSGKRPSHFILIFDATPMDVSILAQSRGSVHSIRRGSTDVRSVGSDYLRRTSLAKLNALPLEAPITKIISLIDQAREGANNNSQVVQLLDKVEDILRCSELYSPHVKEDNRMRADEPVVSDLITALLSKQPQQSFSSSSRRSSNDSSVFRPSRGGYLKVSAVMKDLLDTSLSWEFDIFRLEELSRKRPLQNLGMSLFSHFEVGNSLSCDEKTLFNWLTVIEANYHPDNSYHNSTHAADVMQAIAGFLDHERMKSLMDPMDEATSLLAAAAHDVDHPGRSSAFLSNSDNPLAILYNDVTVLESHHASLTFKLTLGDERINIFKNLDRDTYKLARSNVIDMILATEMTKHFEHLAKFVNVFCTKSSGSELDGDVPDYVPLALPENITLVKRMMIKCADVSNPARPLRLSVEWARRITEEYFHQTDEEKERGLPVVMPMFDRHTCSVPKSQIGFVDYIINDMFEAWNAFIDMPELLMYMRQNYIKWKELDEQGHTTLADIQKLQSTIMMSPMFPPKPTPKSD